MVYQKESKQARSLPPQSYKDLESGILFLALRFAGARFAFAFDFSFLLAALVDFFFTPATVSTSLVYTNKSIFSTEEMIKTRDT